MTPKEKKYLKSNLLVMFVACENSGDWLQSGLEKFEERLDVLLNAMPEESECACESWLLEDGTVRNFKCEKHRATDTQIAKRKIEEYAADINGILVEGEIFFSIDDIIDWLDNKEDE